MPQSAITPHNVTCQSQMSLLFNEMKPIIQSYHASGVEGEGGGGGGEGGGGREGMIVLKSLTVLLLLPLSGKSLPEFSENYMLFNDASREEQFIRRVAKLIFIECQKKGSKIKTSIIYM